MVDRPLTPREREIIAEISVGLTTQQIAVKLGAKYSTIKTHIHNALEKTGCATRSELAARTAKGVA